MIAEELRLQVGSSPSAKVHRGSVGRSPTDRHAPTRAGRVEGVGSTGQSTGGHATPSKHPYRPFAARLEHLANLKPPQRSSSVVGLGAQSRSAKAAAARANAASSSAGAAVSWQTTELRELPGWLPHPAPGHGAHSPQRRQQQWRLLAHLWAEPTRSTLSWSPR